MLLVGDGRLEVALNRMFVFTIFIFSLIPSIDVRCRTLNACNGDLTTTVIFKL